MSKFLPEIDSQHLQAYWQDFERFHNRNYFYFIDKLLTPAMVSEAIDLHVHIVLQYRPDPT